MQLYQRFLHYLLYIILGLSLAGCGNRVVFDGEILTKSKKTAGMTDFLVKVYQIQKGNLQADTIELSLPNDVSEKYKNGIYQFALRKDPKRNPNTPEVSLVDNGIRVMAPLAVDSLVVIPSDFKNLAEAQVDPENVYELNLYFTELDTDLSGLAQFVNVRRMELRGTAQTELPDVFDQFVHLEQLSIAIDNLADLPPSILQLEQLRELTLFGPSIASLPDGWNNLTNLERLTITNTNLTAFPTELSGLPGLKALILLRNKINSVPEIFPEFPVLEQLNLSENAITQLPVFSKCPNLKWVTANKNVIAEIPAHIFENQSLRRLNVAHNQISKLAFPPRCPQPHYALNLRNNPLESIPETICNLQWLSNLDISDLPQEVKLPECLLKMQIKSVRANGNTHPDLVKRFEEEGYRVSVSSL